MIYADYIVMLDLLHVKQDKHYSSLNYRLLYTKIIWTYTHQKHYYSLAPLIINKLALILILPP